MPHDSPDLTWTRNFVHSIEWRNPMVLALFPLLLVTILMMALCESFLRGLFPFNLDKLLHSGQRHQQHHQPPGAGILAGHNSAPPSARDGC